MSLECCLVSISWIHLNLMKSRTEVKSREPRSLLQLIQEFIDNWYWVLPLQGDGIQMSIIHTKVISIVLLLYQQHRRRILACTMLYEACCKHIIDLLLNLIFQCRGIPIGSNMDMGSSRDQRNRMNT
jgi:hypothetical protein